MPPASLPALAAMRPGPAMAAITTRRRHGLRRLRPARGAPRARARAHLPVLSSLEVGSLSSSARGAAIARPPRSLEEPREVEPAPLRQQGVDDVVGEDAPDRPAVLDDEDRGPACLDELGRHRR